MTTGQTPRDMQVLVFNERSVKRDRNREQVLVCLSLNLEIEHLETGISRKRDEGKLLQVDHEPGKD